MTDPSDNPATRAAFQRFREAFGPAKELDPALVANSDQVILMTATDGVQLWKDGSVNEDTPPPPEGAPALDEGSLADKLLWVVAADEVPYAAEQCDFGKALASGVIKHSNLTGGGPAYVGGEMLILDADTVVVNGYSGRYGPRSAAEMTAVALAFRQSGYHVWSMGYDPDANRPLPFIGIRPEWVLDA